MNWIWLNEEEKNSFAEFSSVFYYKGGEAKLVIGADYRYVAYINGRFVSNGQYADLPEYKSMDEADVTDFLNEGENALYVLAWHLGEDFSVCRSMKAGLAFEIYAGGERLAQSDGRVLCRRAKGYRAGDLVTPQIGCGFHYDFTASGEPWGASKVVQTEFKEVPRPVARLKIEAPMEATIAAQGIFKWRERPDSLSDLGTAAERLQNAWLSTLRFFEMTGEERTKRDKLKEPVAFASGGAGGDGVFVIADMGRETCGHLSFSVLVDRPCKMTVGWGEHLADLRVRTKRQNRNFASEFMLSAGENAFDDYLRRIGCRYVCLFVEAERVTIRRLSVREAGYPFGLPEKDFGDRLLNEIYETGRRTLYLCAHEHYEDCPWREQALYGMDSRNQMLFGYGAFEEYEFPRACLRLFARSQREDGLILLCAPARGSIVIPSFTAYWLIAICENAEADYDEAFVKELLPHAERALDAFFARGTKEGVMLFTEAEYWNFHEWSDGLDGGKIFRKESVPAEADCNLTALVCRAAKGIAILEERAGNVEKAAQLNAAAGALGDSLERFYDADKGLYASYVREGEKRGYHAYTQAVALSSGAVPKRRRAGLCEVLKNPGGRVVGLTLAALQIKYDALIEYGDELAFCIDEICGIFGKMLFSGATSYWETEYGEADFEDAGSLCHGWSAVACYVFDKYLNNKKR